MSASLLGNGIGRLYMVDLNFPAAGSLVNTDPNTVAGVRAMRDRGANVTPIASERQPFAIIDITNVIAPFTLNDITILGNSCMSAPVAFVPGPIADFVAAIAADINAFFTGAFFGDIQAQAVNNQLYLFGTPLAGPLLNNQTPILVSGAPANITAVITPFRNGAFPSGAIDPFFGYRFILNPTAGATPNLAGATAPQAVEVTKYMVNRGLNTGLQNFVETINNDRVVGGQWERISGISQLLVIPQSGLSDTLAFIDAKDFVVGDLVYLRVRDPFPLNEIVTVESANNTTSPIPTPNIYLKSDAPYIMTGTDTLVLQQNLNASGEPSWFEVSRSTSTTFEDITLIDFATRSINSELIPLQLYRITDLMSGVFVTALSPKEYNVNAVGVRKIPVNYAGCWRDNMGAPTPGLRYRYYQNVYQSLTGAVGGPPDTDLLNWQLEPNTNTLYYFTRYNSIILASPDNSLLITWPILQEQDSNTNLVRQSYQNFVLLGQNAYDAFGWQAAPAGPLLKIYGNTVVDSVFDCANSDGIVSYNDIFNTTFTNNRLGFNSTVEQNNIEFSTIQNNYFETIDELKGTWTITGNGSALFQNIRIINSSGQGVIANNTYGGGAFTTLILNGENVIASGNTLANNGDVSLTGTNGTISGATITGASCTFNLTNSNVGSGTIGTAGLIATNSNFDGNYLALGGRHINTSIQAQAISPTTTQISNVNFINVNLTNFLGTLTACDFSDFAHAGALDAINNGRINMDYSYIDYEIDLDDPTILSGTTLILPNNFRAYGTYRMVGSGTKDIENIEWLDASGSPNVLSVPFRSVRFYNFSAGAMTVNFRPIPVASYTAPSNVIGELTIYPVEQQGAVPPDFVDIGDVNFGINFSNYVVNYVRAN